MAGSVEADREKRNAALTSVFAAIFLTGMKLVVGVMTGSLGILAEAAHSLLDLVAAVVTFLSVRVSGRPPDKEHMYGHGKIENLSALFETVLLLVTCAWIIYEAIQRLRAPTVEVEVNIWSFLVMGISIVVDFTRSRVLDRAAKKYNSQALEADALHFSTDIWSSSVVIMGLVCVWIANEFNIPWLVKADAVAALFVAGIVIYVSLQLGKRTFDGLLDAAPSGASEAIAARVRAVPGVEGVSSVRVRRSGPETFADVTIEVASTVTLQEADAVATAVEAAVREVAPQADVMVHSDPHDDIANLLQRVRQVATLMRLDVHNVGVQHIGSHVYIALDLEVAPDLSLHDAHEQASALERRLREEIPNLSRVDTHIEPRRQTETEGQDVTAQSPETVEAVRKAMAGLPLISGYHNITIFRSDGHYNVSIHCTFDPATPISDVHEVSEQVSLRVKEAVPSVERVIVHSEP